MTKRKAKATTATAKRQRRAVIPRIVGDPFREGDELTIKRNYKGAWSGHFARGGEVLTELKSTSLLVVMFAVCEAARNAGDR